MLLDSSIVAYIILCVHAQLLTAQLIVMTMKVNGKETFDWDCTYENKSCHPDRKKVDGKVEGAEINIAAITAPLEEIRGGNEN